MPYARKRSLGRRGYKRRAPARRSAVPKKRKTTRTYVRKNAYRSLSNARKINTLFQLRYGPVQRSLQLTSNPITVTKPRPICFDAADFTSARDYPGGSTLGCRIHQVNTVDTGILVAGHFTTANYVNGMHLTPPPFI